jgi:DNA-binding CsgD family transcriptional regulator
LPNLHLILNIPLFRKILQYNKLNFSQRTGTTSHRDKREITLIVLGITALIAALAGISYGVVANHVTAKYLTKVVEDTSN